MVMVMEMVGPLLLHFNFLFQGQFHLGKEILLTRRRAARRGREGGGEGGGGGGPEFHEKKPKKKQKRRIEMKQKRIRKVEEDGFNENGRVIERMFWKQVTQEEGQQQPSYPIRVLPLKHRPTLTRLPIFFPWQILTPNLNH